MVTGFFRSFSAACLLAFAAPLPAFADLSALAGDWVVVDFRRAQYISAPAHDLGALSEGLGQTLTVTAQDITLPGLDCDDWQLGAPQEPGGFAEDPILADLRLPPNDPPQSAGDARTGTTWALSCEGEPVTTLYQAEPRSLVATLHNSSLYMVLERPLTDAQLTRLQSHLITTHFMEPPASGELDASTLAATREWYRYRQTDTDLPVPARIVITRNLLDGTGVWDD